MAVVCTSIALVTPATNANAASTHAATHEMLVFVKAPAGASAAARHEAVARQHAVVALARELGVTGKVLSRTTVPDTVTLRLTSRQASELASSRLVSSVLAAASIPAPANPTVSLTSTGKRSSAKAITSRVTAGPCGSAAKPELDPEALTNINDVPGTTGYDGAGIKVAFLADGVDTTIPDFQRNAEFASAGSSTGSPVITDYEDFSGDGTTADTDGGEAFLDASSIAAQGNTIYDLSTVVNAAHPLPAGCDIRIVGAAPGASLLALKVFSNYGYTTSDGFVQAINYAVANGASVINESFGGNPFPDDAADIVRAADDAAVAAGVTVVVSSGDAGPSSTIGSPSTDPNVISVGATTTFRAYKQYTDGGINWPGWNGQYADNNISSLSSGGFAQDGKTVNLVAPGDLNWAACSTSAVYADCGGSNIELSGGTSESAPLTSGAAADVIEAYKATHGGSAPSPALVERILTSTATDIDAPADEQGAGLLNVGAAVKLATSLPGTSASNPSGVIASTSQVNLVGAPGAKTTTSITLTNTSSKKVTVKLATRTLVSSGGTSGLASIDPSATSSLPKFQIWSGVYEVYQTVKFTVPKKVNRLQFQEGYSYTGQNSLLHVALFSPSGTYEGYSLPQGLGDYGDTEVANPAPGTWSAVMFTAWEGGGQPYVGTSGDIPWAANFYKFATDGTVAKSVKIKGDSSATVSLKETLPQDSGDTSLALILTQGKQVNTIPVTERTLVEVGPSGGDFFGMYYGGNGRSAPGQTNTYEFTVPAGKRDLDVGMDMWQNPAAGDLPGDQFVGMLVDPYGQPVAYDSNFTLEDGTPVVTQFLNLYTTAPAAGTWTLVLDWFQPGTGAVTSIPFDGSIEYNQVSVSSSLPDSPSTEVSQSGATFDVTVNNTGVAPMNVSPDARLPGTVTTPLADVFGSPATQNLPGANDSFYIPTETSSVSIDETGSVPLTFDFSTYTGDPDISPTAPGPYGSGSLGADSATLTDTPPDGVSSGLWYLADDEIGPYGAGGATAGSETTTLDATYAPFDPAVSSPVPDTVESLTLGGPIGPATVLPGTSLEIPITITPTASPNTTVSGTLYINGFTPGSYFTSTIGFTSLFTNTLAAIPYEYTVSGNVES